MANIETTAEQATSIKADSVPADIDTHYEPISIIYDLHADHLSENVGARIAGTNLADLIWEERTNAFLRKPRLTGFLGVAGIATDIWATHENSEADSHLLAVLAKHFKPLASKAIRDGKNQVDPGPTPLIDDKMGRLWLRVFYNKSLERIRQEVQSYVDFVTLLLKPPVSDPSPTSSSIDALLAAVPTNASYPELSERLLTITHDVRRHIAVLLEPILNTHIKNIPQDTYDQKKQLAKWINDELRQFGLAVKCPKTQSPAILVADPGYKAETGRFQFDILTPEGRRKRTLSTPDLPKLEIVEAAPRRVPGTNWIDRIQESPSENPTSKQTKPGRQ